MYIAGSTVICCCDTAENDTKSKLVACLEPFTPENNEKVVQALAAYNINMEVFAAAVEQALLHSKDGSVDTKELREDLKEILAQAVALLRLFPEGEKHATKLEALTKGLL